jgi:hypothetical protein
MFNNFRRIFKRLKRRLPKRSAHLLTFTLRGLQLKKYSTGISVSSMTNVSPAGGGEGVEKKAFVVMNKE